MRTTNFRAWNEIVEKGAVTKSAINGKQLDCIRKETHVVSVMIENVETDAIKDKEDNRPLLHQKRRHRLTGRYPPKVQAGEERALLENEERSVPNIPEEKVYESVMNIGARPCVKITSLKEDAYLATNANPDTLRLMGRRAKSRRKVV